MMSEWQPIETAPHSGRKVLLSFLNELGKRRVIVGFFVRQFTIEDNSDDYERGEFNEQDEIYYWPEGWYESVECHEDFSCCIAQRDSITHWVPLPKPPEQS